MLATLCQPCKWWGKMLDNLHLYSCYILNIEKPSNITYKDIYIFNGNIQQLKHIIQILDRNMIRFQERYCNYLEVQYIYTANLYLVIGDCWIILAMSSFIEFFSCDDSGWLMSGLLFSWPSVPCCPPPNLAPDSYKRPDQYRFPIAARGLPQHLWRMKYNFSTTTNWYKQVSVSSGIGRTEGPKFEMPLKW